MKVYCCVEERGTRGEVSKREKKVAVGVVEEDLVRVERKKEE